MFLSTPPRRTPERIRATVGRLASDLVDTVCERLPAYLPRLSLSIECPRALRLCRNVRPVKRMLSASRRNMIAPA